MDLSTSTLLVAGAGQGPGRALAGEPLSRGTALCRWEGGAP
ncbi:hypothetical protein ACWD0J_28795 [Streptomyces sp. NPDC003011]